MRPKYDEILALWDSGLMLAEVAESAQVSPITARKVIRRERGNPDFTARRNESPRWNARAGAGLAKGRETTVRKMEAERAALRAEFEQAGGSWQALVDMSAARDVGAKVLKARLLKAGAVVPDGRAASPLAGRRRSSEG